MDAHPFFRWRMGGNVSRRSRHREREEDLRIRSQGPVLAREERVDVSPQGNRRGEVHEHWSFFSYDRARKMLVLRQFHQEGFVNRYTLNQQLSKAGKLVFESEQFENFDNKWRAKETYEISSTDEFVEIFELASPEKPFTVYSRNHFKRVKK
jgi:hypothetical protein